MKYKRTTKKAGRKDTNNTKNLDISKKSSTFAGLKIVISNNVRYMLQRKCMFVLLLVALMCSCVSRKELTAFQGVTSETAEEVNKTLKPQPEPRVKINDALIITVSGLDPEAVIPYNLPTVAYESPTSSTVPTSSSFQYYTVDEEGYIDFPILGKLYVVGLRQSEVINLIESKLRGQLVNPIVTMRFLNARVTVLGEVAKPGTYTLNNGRMT